MYEVVIILIAVILPLHTSTTNDVLGCGGFVKSHVQIDFSKVEVKLLTKQGILKDKTTCAPNNGYYFLPIYDKGDYILQLNPPPGWSFSPIEVDLAIDKVNDLCSKGVDINFFFKGFGIAGRVENLGDPTNGPEGVSVELKSDSETRKTVTSVGGTFSFTPVYPGHYKIKVQHSKWKLWKSDLDIEVTEGNTELPQNSLVLHGYSVRGFAKSEGEGVSNTTVLIFSDKTPASNNAVLGCDKTPLPGYNLPKPPLCHVKTDITGSFTFDSVAVGKYYVMPYHFNQNIDVEPNKISFEVSNQDIQIKDNFEIIGFSVKGQILRSSTSPDGISNVKIHMNDKFITETDRRGFYKLEKLKTGVIKIRAEKEKMLFEEVSMKINPNVQTLPAILPSAYEICGRVDSEEAQTVAIVKIGSTFMKNVHSDPKTGKFCAYLPRGTYEIQVQTKQSGKEGKMQFYPISQKIEVFNEDSNIIIFSQLKATVTGTIQCQERASCENLEVYLTPLSPNDQTISAKIKDQKYEFSEILPGQYKLSLSPNRLCWSKDSHDLSVNSITVKAPAFVQSGYAVQFESSHNTKVSYQLIGDSIKENLEIKEGHSLYCLPKDGSYLFEYLGCHVYENKTFTFNTRTQHNVLKLNAVGHSNKLCIVSESNDGPLTALIDKDTEKLYKGPLPYENGCYVLEIMLEPGASAIILPQSDVYYFKPPILTIKGKDDCTNPMPLFEAFKGHVFKGKIVPGIPGTLITLTDDTGESSTTETDSKGFYKFPPMDKSKTYKLVAEKESYQLVGPSENGDFTAFKLAQVIVEVLDESEKTPLQGTLLSLSGGLSYRSNLQTNEEGKITFHSLNPSVYYLKPMMKEYSFEPDSKIIKVQEGETINISLIGKRVAYSAFGIVTSLNRTPEKNAIVEAIGVGNCSHFSEETTTESDGTFRVRGLKPHCTYNLKTRLSSAEQGIPEFVEIKDIRNDVKDLHLIVLRKKQQTTTLVRIDTDVPEYSKMIKLCLYSKSAPTTLIHSIKLDSVLKPSKDSNIGAMIYLPPLPKDGKSYLLQLESQPSQNLKLISQSVNLVANAYFKFAHLEYSIKSNVVEQQIKQTSIWSFMLILLILLLVYNIDVVLQFMNDRFNLKLSTFSAFFKNKMSSTDYHVNDADIDQIVQSINSVKKKPKRNVQ